jgi:hypothetical protein
MAAVALKQELPEMLRATFTDAMLARCDPPSVVTAVLVVRIAVIALPWRMTLQCRRSRPCG